MFAQSRAIPKGAIILWSGSIASIPAGWQLCNGTNGTPDLRDRFVVGAGSTYPVDDTGGALSHDHDVAIATHLHTLGYGSEVAQGDFYSENTNSKVVNGTTDVIPHVPPYYALAYIIKL